MKWFVGMPKNIFQGNPKRFSKKIFQKDFPKKFFANSNKFFRKRVAKDIDPTRVKRIELTNKDKIRNWLETQAHFPQESHSGFFRILRKTILDYFLPFPPAPPLDDKRNVLPDHREK